MADYSLSPAGEHTSLRAATVSRRKLAAGAAALLATPFLAACSDDEDGKDGNKGQGKGKPDAVTFLTALGFTGRESYALVGKAKGFFEEENIDLKVQPGAAGDNNVKMLSTGQAQFTVIDYSGSLVRAGKGQFSDFRIIGVMQQKTTIALMSKQSTGIKSPRDLIGKKVAHPTGSVIKTLFPTYAKLAGLDQEQTKAVNFVDGNGPALPAMLASGAVDAIGQFVPAMPTVQRALKKEPVNVLAYSEYMSDLYGNVLVSRNDLDADLKRRFTKALNRSLHYAVEHPEEAGKLIHEAAKTTPAEGAAKELELLKSYVGNPQGNKEMVARGIALLYSVGLIPDTIEPEEFFDFSVADSIANS